jgi:hypothetical protein
MNADPTAFETAPRANPVHATPPRAHDTWPFGPVGIRQERRKPYRSNEMSMGQTPRRRWSDVMLEDQR